MQWRGRARARLNQDGLPAGAHRIGSRSRRGNCAPSRTADASGADDNAFDCVACQVGRWLRVGSTL